MKDIGSATNAVDNHRFYTWVWSASNRRTAKRPNGPLRRGRPIVARSSGPAQVHFALGVSRYHYLAHIDHGMIVTLARVFPAAGAELRVAAHHVFPTTLENPKAVRMAREIPRATIVGNIESIRKRYPYFLATLRSHGSVPGMGRVIADIKPSQSDELNHRVMAVPLVGRMIFNLARGNAAILGYDLDVYRDGSGENERVSKFDVLVRTQEGHGGSENLKPGIHVVTVRHAGVFSKKLQQIYAQSEEEKEAIELLRKNGYTISGHIVVRSGPRFNKSHTYNITDHDDLRVWEINIRMDFDELAKKFHNHPVPELDPSVFDPLHEGTKKGIEAILKAAGAWQPVGEASWYETQKGFMRISFKWLRGRWKNDRWATKNSQTVSIHKLDRALKKFIPGSDPQAISHRDVYIDATNRLNRSWLYDLLAESNDLRSAILAYEEKVKEESVNITDRFLEGRVAKREMGYFIKYIDRLDILESLKSRVRGTDDEIMKDFFELRETRDWHKQKLVLKRARWLERKFAMRIRKVRKQNPQQQEHRDPEQGYESQGAGLSNSSEEMARGV